jgi:hypothetical protein
MIIETRDPQEARDVDWVAGLAADLHRQGATASVMLVENGVFAARAGAAAPSLQVLTDVGCPVFADRYALEERGIKDTELAPGVTPGELDLIIDALNAGASVLWR